MKRNLWLGVGLQTAVSAGDLAEAIAAVLHQTQLDKTQIAGIATIASKNHHPAIQALVAQYAWQLRTFEPAELAAITVPSPSIAVQTQVATASVAEAAAIAAARGALIWPKQIQRRSSGFVTWAIAAEFEV
ncbi:MAG: cobalamin biosynthesis protein [Alkalinema sp. RU_4_3]|nr:cobalamin biosynthesis protein [Alkalinema sp. RU_4_3]